MVKYFVAGLFHNVACTRIFQTRYEDYDLPDPDCYQWLTIHHPESVSAEQPLHTSPFNPDEMFNNQESLTDLHLDP